MIRHVVPLTVAACALSIGSAGASDTKVLSFTSFEGFNVGESVDHQGGWKTSAEFDEGVVQEDVRNVVWRVSNEVTSGAFGNQPFAPCPGGLPINTVNDPVNGEPQWFAGEESTGAKFKRFRAEFGFRSATVVPQIGARITVSADNCQGGRQSFIAIEDHGSGLEVATFDVDKTGNFIGPITIASGLSYTEWHTVAVELRFKNGPNNDVARYFVDGERVHKDHSWEQFYRNFQADLHPVGVPVQTLIFRLSGTAVPGVAGSGFYVDDVLITASHPRGKERDDDDHDDD